MEKEEQAFSAAQVTYLCKKPTQLTSAKIQNLGSRDMT